MKTMEAYRDDGKPQVRLKDDLDHARSVMEQLPEIGIDIDEATQELEDEGIEKFCKPFDALLETLRNKTEEQSGTEAPLKCFCKLAKREPPLRASV